MKRISNVAMVYGAGYSIFVACRMLQAMLLAYLLGPALFGIWSVLTLIRQYGQHSDLGMAKGISQLVPKYSHSGHWRRAQAITGLGWVVGMVSTGIVSLFLIAHAVVTRDASAPWFVESLITLILLLFIDKHYACVTAFYQSTERVLETGIWMGILGTLELLLGAVLTSLFGLPGLYVSLVLCVLIVAGGMQWRGGIPFIVRLNRKLLAQLFASSLLLTGFGLLNVAVHNLDRVAVAAIRGAGPELSYYHVASLLAMIVAQLPAIVMAALAPRIYRFSRNDRFQLQRYAVLPTALIACVSAAVAAVLWLTLPLVFDCLLPEYRPALPVARILILGEFFYASTMAMENVNVSLGRAHYTLAARAGLAIAALAVAWWLLARGAGLLPVAMASCAVHVGGWLLSSWIVTRGLQIHFWKFGWLVIAPLSYGGLVAALSTSLFPNETQTGMLAALGCCVLGVVPLAMTSLAFANVHMLETVGVSRGVLDWWRNHVVSTSSVEKGLVNVGVE